MSEEQNDIQDGASRPTSVLLTTDDLRTVLLEHDETLSQQTTETISNKIDEQTAELGVKQQETADMAADAAVQRQIEQTDAKIREVMQEERETEGDPTATTVLVDAAQWQSLADAGRFCCTCALLCLMLVAALCGLTAWNVLARGLHK